MIKPKWLELVLLSIWISPPIVGAAIVSRYFQLNTVDMLVSLETVKSKLTELNWKIAREVDREVVEGAYHTGLAAVVQILGEAF
jgi:hypothetical protein